MPKITVYQPAEAIEVDVIYPAYRCWKNFCYYKVISEAKSIQVMDSMHPEIQSTNYGTPQHAFAVDSVEIAPEKFYEAYARVRQSIDEACGITFSTIEETLY